MKLPGGTAATVDSPASPVTAAASLQRDRTRTGVIYGLAAYLSWGVFPLYLLLLKDVPSLIILGHRIIWSVVLLAFIVTVQRRFDELRRSLRSLKVVLMLLLSTVMIGINWYTYVWAVGHHQITQASLGYFINPMVSVLLGVLFLKERMTRWQVVAVATAVAAIGARIALEGTIPVVTLTLALSFALYGLLRKVIAVSPLIGLLIESALLLIPSIIVVLIQPIGDAGSAKIYVLLILSGVVTAMPLIWFTAAAQRLKLSTVGFLQYIAPSCQFLIGTFVNHEPLTKGKLIAFGGIWLALVIFSADALLSHRTKRRMRAMEPEPEI